jgi:hypothetical protein
MKGAVHILALLVAWSVSGYAAKVPASKQPAAAAVIVEVDETIPGVAAPVLARAVERFLSFRLEQQGYTLETADSHPEFVISIAVSGPDRTDQTSRSTSAVSTARWAVDPPLGDLRWKVEIVGGEQADSFTVRFPGSAGCPLLPRGTIVLMRLADSVAVHVPVRLRRLPAMSGAALPVHVYVDSTFIRRHEDGWDRKVHELVGVTSRSLETQLGVGLIVEQLMPIDVGRDAQAGLVQLHLAMHAQRPSTKSGLVLGLYGDRAGSEQSGYGEVGVDHIGYASLEKRRVTITDVSLPGGLEHWWALVMSRVLFHEVCHALGGAVHVWASEAIMNPLFVWPLSDSLDPMNHRLMSSILAHRQKAGSKAQHVQRVFDAIGGAGGDSLVDWPQFAYDFTDVLASTMRGVEINDELRSDLLASATGVELLKSADSARAAGVFERLAHRYPRQGSFWYWWWRLQPTGAVADTALAKAAGLGYYPAQMELVKGM